MGVPKMDDLSGKIPIQNGWWTGVPPWLWKPSHSSLLWSHTSRQTFSLDRLVEMAYEDWSHGRLVAARQWIPQQNPMENMQKKSSTCSQFQKINPSFGFIFTTESLSSEFYLDFVVLWSPLVPDTSFHTSFCFRAWNRFGTSNSANIWGVKSRGHRIPLDS